MNARRVALRIFSGKIIYNFGIAERLRTLRYPIFTGKSRSGKRQRQRWFPAETVALRGMLLPSSPTAMPPSPRGRLFALPQSFPPRKRRPLRGSWLCAAKTEGAYLFRFCFCFFCTKCSAGRVFLLTSGQMFRTIISSMESKTLYAGLCVTLYPFQAKCACLI